MTSTERAEEPSLEERRLVAYVSTGVAVVSLAAGITLGVLAALTLAATTDAQDLLIGLRRLRLPDQLVQIMGFMLRYLDVVTAEMARMLTAMRSRGFDPRSPRHWPVLASSLRARWYATSIRHRRRSR